MGGGGGGGDINLSLLRSVIQSERQVFKRRGRNVRHCPTHKQRAASQSNRQIQTVRTRQALPAHYCPFCFAARRHLGED